MSLAYHTQEEVRKIKSGANGELDHSELVVTLRQFGFFQAAIARATGASTRSVRAWEAGGNIRQNHEDRLRDLAKIIDALIPYFGKRAIQQYLMLRTPEDATCERIADFIPLDRTDEVLARIAAVIEQGQQSAR